MALGIISTSDEKAYWEGATHLHPLTAGTDPVDFQHQEGVNRPSNNLFYYDRLDLIYSRNLQGGSRGFVSLDPLYIDNSSAAANLWFPLSNGSFNMFAVGQWDKANNEQRIYATEMGASLTEPWVELSPADMTNEIEPDPYPNVGIRASRSGTTTGDPFHYRFFDGDGGGWVFFEGYNGGVAYAVGLDVWTASGSQRDYTMGIVDLNTGLATFDSAFITRYTTTPANSNQQGPFAGDVFDMWNLQFVPDEDNLLDAPKGQFILTGDSVTGVLANEQYLYIAIYDFNPENRVGGVPNRVHGRLRLITRLSYFTSTAFSTPGGIGLFGTSDDPVPIFHPPTRTFRLYTGQASFGTETNITADTRGMNVYSGVPVLNTVTKPTALKQPRTNARVDFASVLLGDLGEPIGGQDVTFSLVRVSTKDENLGTSDGNLGATAGDFSLTNVPLDDLEDVRSVTSGPTGTETTWTPRITNTGSGNEVEVNLTNGDLQFYVAGVATNLPLDDFVLATYNHLNVEATPAHGTLLTLGTRSDENGQVTAQVRYPDDDTLEDEWDKLIVTTV